LSNVSLNARNVSTDGLNGLIEFLLTTAGNVDVGTLFDEEPCCKQPYPGCATGNHCYSSLQLLSLGHRECSSFSLVLLGGLGHVQLLV
jgi:hypothetical protein